MSVSSAAEFPRYGVSRSLLVAQRDHGIKGQRYHRDAGEDRAFAQHPERETQIGQHLTILDGARLQVLAELSEIGDGLV